MKSSLFFVKYSSKRGGEGEAHVLRLICFSLSPHAKIREILLEGSHRVLRKSFIQRHTKAPTHGRDHSLQGIFIRHFQGFD